MSTKTDKEHEKDGPARIASSDLLSRLLKCRDAAVALSRSMEPSEGERMSANGADWDAFAASMDAIVPEEFEIVPPDVEKVWEEMEEQGAWWPLQGTCYKKMEGILMGAFPWIKYD